MDRGLPFVKTGAALAAPAALFDGGRRIAFSALAVALVAIAALHWDTVASLARTWNQSTTYAYGWLVAPIAFWLAVRKRHALAATPLAPSALGFAAIALAGFVWLLAHLANVAAVAQFALVGTLIATVVAVFGWRAARVLAFALVFLFFAVPAGDFLVPALMDWTATATTVAVRATGIPVYREGNYFVLPSGEWSVVEACSGLRYLVASFMTGTLYAYLTYRSLWRRLAFVACAIMVPILANWARAYIIVMLGHLSNNRIAAGADHLVYGWIFFGIVIALMFWIGARWREDGGPREVPAPIACAGHRRTLVAALVAIAVAAIAPVSAALLAPTAHPAIRLTVPVGAQQWTPVEERADWSPRFVGQRAELRQSFEKAGVGRVGLYVAYYQAQTEGHELVSYENMLVGPDERLWREGRRLARQFRWGDATVEAPSRELVSRKDRLLARHVYWIDGRVVTNDYAAKARLAWATLTGAGDGSAAIVLYTTTTDTHAEADARLDRFAQEMGAAIDGMIAGAGSGGR